MAGTTRAASAITNSLPKTRFMPAPISRPSAIAAISTLLALLIGYPLAYFIARSPEPRRSILLLLVILPFWTSFLLRVYAWIGLLRRDGVINGFLLWTGIIDQPLVMLQTDFGGLSGHRLYLFALHDPCRSMQTL